MVILGLVVKIWKRNVSTMGPGYYGNYRRSSGFTRTAERYIEDTAAQAETPKVIEATEPVITAKPSEPQWAAYGERSASTTDPDPTPVEPWDGKR